MRVTLLSRSTVLACALLSLAAGVVRADGPRTELARLVPDKVAVCLVIGDLRGQADKMKQSAWLKKVRESPLGRDLAEALNGAKLGQFGDLLQKRLGVTWPQLRDEVLGDAVIFAYQPGPPDRPDDEQGLLLLQVRSPAVLAKLMERLNAVQKKSGELKKLEARQHQGKTYFRRVEGDGEQFYHLDGGLLAFSGHEAMLKRVLERAAAPKAETLPPLAEHVKLAGADKALVTLWVNPRALDAELQDKFAAAEGQAAHVLKVLLRYWRGLEGVSLALTLEPVAEVRVALQARRDQLPPAAQRVAVAAAQPSELWSRFPKDAVLTAAGRVDVAALLEVFREWTPPEADQKLRDSFRGNPWLEMSRKLFGQLLAQLGPDCGLSLTTGSQKEAPPQLLLAVRLQSGKPGQALDRKLYTGMMALVALAVTDHNRTHKDQIRMKTLRQGKVEVKYLVNGKEFPKGFRPAFALKEGYLVVASSPEAVVRFAAGPAALPDTTDGTPLLRLNVRQLTRLLKEQREGVLAVLAKRHGLQPELAAVVLEGLKGGLDLFEDVRLTQRNEGPRTLWLLRLRSAAK